MRGTTIIGMGTRSWQSGQVTCAPAAESSTTICFPHDPHLKKMSTIAFLLWANSVIRWRLRHNPKKPAANRSEVLTVSSKSGHYRRSESKSQTRHCRQLEDVQNGLGTRRAHQL